MNHEQNEEYKVLCKFFDECFKQERFDSCHEQEKIGMTIKNNYGDSGYNIFKYYINKSSLQEIKNNLYEKYNSYDIINCF